MGLAAKPLAAHTCNDNKDNRFTFSFSGDMTESR
jgi:hypothetical protein